jgi:hypothetical protein
VNHFRSACAPLRSNNKPKNFLPQTSRDREKHRNNTRDTERTKANGRYDDGLPKAII